MSATVAPPLRSSPATAAAVLALLAGGAAVAGLPGALVGLVVLAVRIAGGPVYAVAAGQVAVAAVAGSSAGPEPLLALEGLLLAVLVGDLVDHRRDAQSVALALAAVGGAGAVAVAATRLVAEVWLATVVVALLLALASYAAHRYTVVRFELTHEH
ncbi:hypothetical protein [Halomicrobium salinisoli]|uniref:hypothetical protein n=1 Tax=Halomicrobium salinisoli TaxID=2878391 RepID=UPI001CEFBE56|nr:hypothetical protein [Halomicrobium salinisoli]